MNVFRVAVTFNFVFCLFSCLQGQSKITVNKNVEEVFNYITDIVTWQDSKGLTRELYFTKGEKGKPESTKKGYIIKATYYADKDVQVVCQPVKENRHGDMAHVGLHSAEDGGTHATTQTRYGHDFNISPVFHGENHLIYRVSFWLYAYGYKLKTDSSAFKVTIDWVFYNGLDHALFSITHDCSRDYKKDGDPFTHDGRGPYTSFDWDGNGIKEEFISGLMYGTHRKFKTFGMKTWEYKEANIIPFVWEWKTEDDREIGYVQTETFTQQRGGGEGFGMGGDYEDQGYKYSDRGQGDTRTIWRMHYQMNGYQQFKDNRITWGMPYGAVDGGYGTEPPYQCYTLAIIMGKYSENGVKNLITETELIHSKDLNFSVSSGEIITSGIEGPGNPNVRPYSPAGYNHVLRTWELKAGEKQSTFNFDVNKGSYKNPVFVLHNYTGNAIPAEITLNGKKLKNQKDFLCSLDTKDKKLYCTLLKRVKGKNKIVVFKQRLTENLQIRRLL